MLAPDHVMGPAHRYVASRPLLISGSFLISQQIDRPTVGWLGPLAHPC